MKLMTLAALAGILVSSAAFAQTPASQDSTSAGAMTIAQQSPDGQSSASYDQPIAGKTRAQVYQGLVHAEQDGQLAHLDRTVYAHH
jgi:hypothetical protein